MYLYIISKLISESLLSLYPIFIKSINISLEMKLWTRFTSYLLISLFFINWKFVIQKLFSLNGFLLGFITLLHVYFSYRGFELLDSGVAYTLFYTYPMIILLLSGNKLNYMFLLTLLGVFLLSKNEKIKENFKQKMFSQNQYTQKFKYEGIIMILLASLTEAFIYFIVRNIKTVNNWNHLFLSYFLGGILLTFYFHKKIVNINIRNTLSVSMIINIVIGLVGYLLRFYATTRLNTKIYAYLSYFGIVMSYLYGILINKEKLNITKIIGTLLIIFPNIWNIYK